MPDPRFAVTSPCGGCSGTIPATRRLLACLSLLLLAGCDCSGTTEAACETNDDCATGEVCSETVGPGSRPPI
jgi:hypothetical protein